MIITTTGSVEGRSISSYLGIVSGEAILGANFMRDFAANITDALGGRAAGFEDRFQRARSLALAEMEQWAQQRGADAIVGVSLDHEAMGAKAGMMMVTASGTAVRLA